MSIFTIIYIIIGLLLKRWEKYLENQMMPDYLRPYALGLKKWGEPKPHFTQPAVLKINGKLVDACV